MFAKFCQGKEIDTAPTESLPLKFDTTRRTSVSAECWTQPGDSLQCGQSAYMTSRQARLPPVTPSGSSTSPHSQVSHIHQTPKDVASTDGSKTVSPESLARAAKSLRNTIFFEELSDNLMELVLNALVPRSVEAGVEVIKQGDEGNELFILDEGEVEFIVSGTKQGTANSGATFGELALLYNSPRAATVRTLVPTQLFALDRMTFKTIMVAKLSDKRMHSQQVLASIDAFSQLSDVMRLRISDALHPTSFKKGDIVIKEGDSGSNFYLIDEGTVDVTKDGKLLSQLSSGNYFGELALIYDLPRAATITVTSAKLKLEVLSKTGFEQLIGPDLVSELQRRDPRKHA